MQPFSEWSCWRMFIETWPHSEVMICDKYREQTALYVPLLLCTAFSQLSDFNHFTPMTETGILTRKNILQKMKYQRNCWRTDYLMFLKTLIVTVKMTVNLLLLEIDQNNIYILYRALLGSLVSISWKFQFTKIVSEFVINF